MANGTQEYVVCRDGRIQGVFLKSDGSVELTESEARYLVLSGQIRLKDEGEPVPVVPKAKSRTKGE